MASKAVPAPTNMPSRSGEALCGVCAALCTASEMAARPYCTAGVISFRFFRFSIQSRPWKPLIWQPVEMGKGLVSNPVMGRTADSPWQRRW